VQTGVDCANRDCVRIMKEVDVRGSQNPYFCLFVDRRCSLCSTGFVLAAESA
jgi:hypothetical protein